MNARLVWLIVTVLVLGCGWPFSQETNPNVEIIVPDGNKIADWALSPGGDKIVYRSPNSATTFLLFPATQQKYNFLIVAHFTGLII